MPIAHAAHTRSRITSDDWITPKWLIERLGPFDLDPCECVPQPWRCASIGYSDNGLMRDWFGFVYLNPPYGSQTRFWLNRLALHGSGIALVFARTETSTFRLSVWPYASRLLFLYGRLSFSRPNGTLVPNGNGNSGGPSVLIGYGETAANRLESCSDIGAIVKVCR